MEIRETNDNHLQPKLVKSSFNGNYVEYKGHGDKDKKCHFLFILMKFTCI